MTQMYGVLPPKIAARIESSSVANLDPADPQYASKVAALHAEFLQSDPGPLYVSCYESYVNCLFDPNTGVLIHPQKSMSRRMCVMGGACVKGAPDGKPNPAVPTSRRQRFRR